MSSGSQDVYLEDAGSEMVISEGIVKRKNKASILGTAHIVRVGVGARSSAAVARWPEIPCQRRSKHTTQL